MILFRHKWCFLTLSSAVTLFPVVNNKEWFEVMVFYTLRDPSGRHAGNSDLLKDITA